MTSDAIWRRKGCPRHRGPGILPGFKQLQSRSLNAAICRLWSGCLSLAVAAIFAATLVTASAQQADGPEALRHALVFAGTSIRTNNHNWAYLLWQAGDDSLLEGRTLALYRKVGDPQAAALYKMECVITHSWDTRLAESVLKRATNVGDDLTLLANALQSNFHDILPPSSAGLAEQALYCIQTAVAKPELRGHIAMLARKHPAMAMLLGTAHVSELPASGQVTYELRDYDPVKKSDRAVIGRSTVTVGQPLVLPNPGVPVLVPPLPGEGARTHLSARLRWATPTDLRGVAILQFGFNVYRVSASYVQQHGFPWEKPSLAQLQAAVANPGGADMAVKVNRLPVVPDDDLDADPAGDIDNDRSTVFFIDDNDALQGGNRFDDGAKFYYYITARDVLGRDGTPSPGANIQICDTMPPLPPGHVRATPVYHFIPANGATPASGYHHFRVSWRDPGLRASDRPGEESIGGFYVYRWDSVQTMNHYAPKVNPATGVIMGDAPVTPDQGALIADVHAVAGQDLYSWDDVNGPKTPANTGTSYVYTVRAYDNGACARNLSGDSGPAIGNLLDLELSASSGGTSSIIYTTLVPKLTAKPAYTVPGATAADPAKWAFELQCTANSGGTADYAEFECPVGTLLGHVRFGAGVLAGQQLARLSVLIPFQPGIDMPLCRIHLRSGTVTTSTAAALNIGKPSSGYCVVPWELSVDRKTHSHEGLPGDYTTAHVPDPPTPSDPAVPGNDYVGPTLHLVFPPGATRWQLLRQIDAGDKAFYLEGSAVGIPFLDVPDVQPAPGNCRYCYYLKTFDAANKPSEPSLVDCIYQRSASTLPRPVLAALENAKTSAGQPAMRVLWTCPPYSVERFLVQIETDGDVPMTGLSNLSDNLLGCGQENQDTGADRWHWVAWYQTTRVQVMPDYPRSSFSALVPVHAGQHYRVTVQAAGPGQWRDRNIPLGELSDAQEFLWNNLDSTGNGDPTTGAPRDQSVDGGAGGTLPNSTLPWPARPLPPLLAPDARFALTLKKQSDHTALLDTRFGPMVRVGNSGDFQIGSRPLTIYEDPLTHAITTRIQRSFDPRLFIYQINNRGLLPCMLYRRQATVGGVKHAWIQVTPLIEDIAYEAAAVANDNTTIIHDPWFVIPEPLTGTKSPELFLVDRHPVVRGTTYEYALLLFDAATKEPSSTLPLGEITVQ
ncbi:MAG: hypothetical protein WCP35_00395 [Verrucomicrobiota bacterium]